MSDHQIEERIRLCAELKKFGLDGSKVINKLGVGEAAAFLESLKSYVLGGDNPPF